MKLESVQVSNYKCYAAPGALPVGRQFTVLVGQNNAGKTAFSEALTPNKLTNKPHRVPKGVGRFDPIPDPTSRVKYGIAVSGAELLYNLLSAGANLAIPVTSSDKAQVHSELTALFSSDRIFFELEVYHKMSWRSEHWPSHHLFPPSVQPPSYARVQVKNDRREWFVAEIGTSNVDDLPVFVGNLFSKQIYAFRAERMNLSECEISPADQLEPDASNLASVLLSLPLNQGAHSRFLEHVRTVFPSVFHVGSAQIANNRVRASVIMADALDEARPQAGITVSLNESGTGISQVLAILYVALTAPDPRIIVIDEPNSFLHPGAVKKLVTILRGLPHQYVITTHSADIIRTVEPEVLHLASWKGSQSSFRTLDQTRIQDQRRVLDELGVRLSDVFGADNVLWVEGATEAKCFPLVLKHLGTPLPGTVVVPIVAIDDLTGDRVRASLVWELYERLSSGNALVPPALAFSLDRETRSVAKMEDLQRQSRGRVHFLPRRTYENYLLHPQAISAVLSDALPDDKPSPSTVEQWLEGNRLKAAYMDQWAIAQADEHWDRIVNAPKLLADAFSALSDATVQYWKTQHSAALTQWLLANDPDALKELTDYVASLVADGTAATS